MKKVFLALLLAVLSVSSLSAQETTTTKIYKEPRVRFGIGYRFSLGVAEQNKLSHNDFGYDSSWETPYYRRGGDIHVEMTVRITSNWNVGAGWAFGKYGKDSWQSHMIYAKAEYLYGNRPGRWFNYGELGTTIDYNHDAGLMANVGGGYRFAITRRTRLDLTLGMQYLNIVGEGHDTWRTNRIGILFGIAMHF